MDKVIAARQADIKDNQVTKPFTNKSLIVSALLLFILGLLVLGLVYQHGYNYSIAIGTPADSSVVYNNFGDPEHNNNFDFRWTLGQATLKLPNFPTNNQIELQIGLGPRPSNQPLKTLTMQIGDSAPQTLPMPPLDSTGFATVIIPDNEANFSLQPLTLTLNTDTFQVAGDNRSLGVVMRQLKIVPTGNLRLPPLAAWFGLALELALLFLLAGFAYATTIKTSSANSYARFFRTDFKVWQVAGLVWLVGLGVVSAAIWFKPATMAVYAGPLVWGSVFPLLIGLVRQANWRAFLALLYLALTLRLVFFGNVAPIFGYAAFGVTAVVLGWYLLKAKFSHDFSNVVWLIAISAGVTWGLWQNKLPRTDDLPFYHLYWNNELDRMIQQGNFYPRWAADFSYGQGNAVFNYYAPGARYIAEFFHLQGLSFNASAMALQTFCIMVGSIGAYFWCRKVQKYKLVALLGAISWLFFPFTIADLYVGGGISNTLGAAIYPFVFWTLLRLIKYTAEWQTVLWAATALGILAASHTPLTLLLIPFGGLYCLGLLILYHQNRATLLRTIFGLAVAGIVGIALAAFFILPAVIEKELVPFFYANFGGNAYAPWPDALALWRAIYPNMTNYSLLGTLHPLLALIGLTLIFRYVKEPMARKFSLFLAGMLLLSLILQLPIMSFVWDAVPIFKSVQFTSRLLDFAVIFGAPLLGSLALPLATRLETVKNADKAEQIDTANSKNSLVASGSYTLPLIAIALMVYACFGQLTFAYWPVSFDGSLSLKTLQEQIKNGDPEYIPHWATNLNAIQTFRPPSFADNRALSAQDKLQMTANDPINRILTASLSKPGTVSVPIFYYPGWHAFLNSQDLPLQPQKDTGLITFQLPSGQSTIYLDFKDTPIRFFSDVLSLLTLTALLAVGIFSLARRLPMFNRSFTTLRRFRQNR